jgi:hypothetical protein
MMARHPRKGVAVCRKGSVSQHYVFSRSGLFGGAANDRRPEFHDFLQACLTSLAAMANLHVEAALQRLLRWHNGLTSRVNCS